MGGTFGLLHFSKIQLVVYHQCCVLIGFATSRLYVIAYSTSSEKRPPYIYNVLPVKKDSYLALTCERCFVSIFFDQLVGFY